MFDAKFIVRKNMVFLSLCMLMLWLWITDKQAFAQTRLAIHATQEEVNIWKERSVSGPYLADWDRIKKRADDFLSKPNIDKWDGNQLNQCWNGDKVKAETQPPNQQPGRSQAQNLRDAGFVYLVTGKKAYRDQVHKTLVEQADIVGTNFANTTRWCTNYNVHGNDMEMLNWLRKLTYGYSYIRSSLSEGDRNALDAWFRIAGTYWKNTLNNILVRVFPNRQVDNYTCKGTCPGKAVGVTHFGGPTFHSFHHFYNNVAAVYPATIAAIGVTINDAAMKAEAKRFVKEWLIFCVAPDGTICDQYRWKDGDAQTGFNYAGTALGSIISVADHLARDGDLELFTFSTTEGLFGYAGGPKTLQRTVERLARLVIAERNLGAGGVTVYGSTSSTINTAKRIGPGTTHITEIVLAPANLFYKNALITTAYTRTMPSKPSSGGYNPWGGDWGTYPGLRFMFGKLEGIVQPYKSAQVGQLPTPTRFRVVTE